MTDYAFMVSSTARNYGPAWYPGDGYVDAMATDSYNWYQCRTGNQNIPWWSLAYVTEFFRRFGLQHPSVPMWETEFGSVEDPAVTGRKASWFDDARALFATPAYSQFKGVMYFNWSSTSGDFANCVWRVDSSASSLDSFAGMANDPVYSGVAGWDTTPAPNVPPLASFASSTDGHAATLTSTSTDPDGRIASTSWDFGDGSTGDGVHTTHTYAAAGTYSVKVTVTDDRGGVSSVAHDVSVTDPVATSISFVASTASNANTTVHKVVVPAGTQAGDALVLAFTANTLGTVGTPTGVNGWRLLGTRTTGTMSSRIWSMAAPAASAGTTVSVPISQISKGNLLLSVYRGTSTTDPVASVSSASEGVARTDHTTPPVSVAGDRSWVVSYWAQKDSGTTLFSPPAGVEVRSNTGGSPAGRIIGLLADSGSPTGAGVVPGRTATAGLASATATMWSIVLAAQ